RPGVDAAVAERVAELREQVRRHPCHRCPDREAHAREAERALWLERENQRTETKMSSRTNTIAQKFDRICQVLESFGYLSTGGVAVTDAGRTLARIYNELDLVTAECIRAGVFDHLSVPQLAAVLSTLVFQARRSDDGRRVSMPDADSEVAVQAVRRIWREVSVAERDARLDRAAEIDLGFARAAYGWADDQPLGPLLLRNGLTAGDFVRWVRQVIDFADQVGQAAGPGTLRSQARAVVAAMRRGVVAFVPEEDEDLVDELIIAPDAG
ncbi:MAG: RNA helicase, partial [Propionibacteriales bacterium]|nr:RNA helicase [Propionibacteriales bacterium]